HDVVAKELYGVSERGIACLYAGVPPEVLDPTYLPHVSDPNFPNHPAPPYLQRDLWDLLTHPDVPLASFQTGYGELPGAAGGAKPIDNDNDAPLARPGGPGGVGMPGGGEGGPGMMRGPGMMPGGPGGGSMPGMPGGMRPGGSGMPGGG